MYGLAIATSLHLDSYPNSATPEKEARRRREIRIAAVSTIIFTASAQHAAVNFAQGELMTYPPAFPLASYSPAPTNLDQPGDFMSMLPSIEQAKTQLKLTYLLGSVYYTQLGQYSNSKESYKNHALQILATFPNSPKYKYLKNSEF